MCSFFLLLLQYIVPYQAEEISIGQILGCFPEHPICKEQCSILPESSTVQDPKQVLSTCAAHCRNKNCTYFGREGKSGACRCGKLMPRFFGQVNLLICGYMCADESEYAEEDAFRCGGEGFLSVYRTCSVGRYGTDCAKECRCPESGPCTINGICYGKDCDKGWISPSNSAQPKCSVRDCSIVNGDCLTQCNKVTNAASPGCSCLRGYKLVDGVSCEDLNECSNSDQNCSTCVNNNGSSACTCLAGFTAGWVNGTESDTPICIEMNECATTTTCGSFQCTNTYGSYKCVCPTGYAPKGDGTSCEDINECELKTTFCQSCQNTPGNATCVCQTGFTPINYRCEDIDECKTGQHNCQQQPCENTNGSYICVTTPSTRPVTTQMLTTTSTSTTSATRPVTTQMLTTTSTSTTSATRPVTTQMLTTTSTSTTTTTSTTSTTSTTTTVPTVAGCRITRVLLSGGSKINEASYAYRRSVNVQFQATVQSSCQLTKPLQYLWKIMPIDSASIPLIQETLQVDYYTFNPASAEFGKYVTELTVLMPSVNAGRNDETVSKTYFQIVRTELHAILRGGSAVTIDIKESVKLDASLSVDPDAETSGISNLKYTWYCVRGKKILPMVAGRLADGDSGCHGEWAAPLPDQQRIEAFPTPYTTLPECQQFCVYDLYCSGIFIDSTSNAYTYCWVKIQNSSPVQLTGVAFYALRSRTDCNHVIKIYADSPTPCQGSWSQPEYNKHVAGGIPTHDQNAVECQRHCILDSLCIGIDLRYILGSPYCWLMVQPGPAQPLVGSIHLELQGRTGCDDTTNAIASDCIANEHVLLSKSSIIIEFPTSVFLNFHQQPDYTFTVVVSKPFFLSQSISQTVTLIDARPTNYININCELNCDLLMNPSFALVLRASCLRCSEQSYRWSIAVGSKGPVQMLTPQDTTGGLNSAVLSIKPNVFKSAANNLYMINLIVTYDNQVTRSSNYSFETTGSPIVDRCFIDPNVGYAMQTDFSIACVGGVGSLPLTYTFTLRGCTGGGDTSILYKGINPDIKNLKLPSGDPGNSYMLCVSATISDRYAVKTTLDLKATVSADTFTLADLQEMTRNASRLKAQGDIAGSTCLLDLIAFTTNELTKKNLLKDSVGDKKQFRLALVNAISGVSGVAGGSSSPDSTILQQSVTALRKATSNPDEIDASGITKAIDLRTLSANIGDSGKNLQPEVRSNYYDESYRQLFQVGSNLMTSARNAAKDKSAPEAGKGGRNVVDTVMDVLDSANKKLAKTTFLERNTTIKTDVFTASVSSVEPSNSRRTTVASDDFSVSLPPELFSGVPADESNEFKISVITFKDNPFWWANASDQITSGCAKIIVTRKDAEHEAPKSMSSSVAISLPTRAPVSRANESVATIYPENVAFFDVDIHPPGGTGAVLKMIINSNSTQLDGTATFRFCRGKRADVRARLSVNNYCDCITVWTAMLSGTKRPQSMTAKLEVDMISALGNFLIVEYANSEDVAIDVTLKTAQIFCRFWEKESSKWDQSGCVPDVDNSSPDLIVCNCSHLSSFAGSFIVKPNSIDIVKNLNMFLVPWQNPVGLVLVCVIWLLFLLALLWARRKDKFDALMALPIDLEDNSLNARYVYLVTVFTGSRYGSGTTSDVYVCLIGDLGTSASHRLQCREYEVLQQGHVNIFILRTVESLGKLRAIRFWHYNSGKHPQWFLSRVIVYDTQSLVASHFLCQSWLTLNMENGVVDRTFLVATPQEVEGFQHLFFINTLRGLNDKHIWISVVGRPPLSTFSRIQRVACCLSLILGYLLTNMMFFQVQTTYEQRHMKLGVFTLDWAMVAIAIESALVMFPVTLLTVSMFRNMRPPPQEYKLLRQWEKAVDANFNKYKEPTKASSSGASLATSEPKSSSISSKPSTDKQQHDAKQTDGMYTPKSTDSSKPESTSMFSNLFKVTKPSGDSSSSNVNASASAEPSDPETGSLHGEPPASDKYYSEKSDGMYMDKYYSEGSEGMQSPESSSTSENVSSEFPSRTSRSVGNLTDEVEFQSVIEGDTDFDQKKLPWWTAYIAATLIMCASIGFSFLIIMYTFEFGLQKSLDWLKVVILSFCTGIFIQEPLKVVGTAIVVALIFKRSDDIQITNSDSITEDSVRGLQAADKRHLIHFNQMRMHPHYHPPTRKSVITARDMITRQLAMYKIIWEIIRYVVFIVLALVITNIRRDYNIFMLNNSYKRCLFDEKPYKQIDEREAFWKWTTTSWMNFIYADDRTNHTDFSNSKIDKSKGANGSNILGLMGSGMSVLMRSPRLVRFPKGTDYPLQFLYSNDTGPEDTVSLGMTRREAEAAVISLIQKNWVNRRFGGAILEAVSYTASADLLSILLVILELPSPGGINVYNYYHTLKFHQYQETFQLISFGLEIIYFVFTLWFLIYVVKRMFQLGRKNYFGSFWNWLDIAIVLLSVSLIVVYALLNVLLYDTVQTYEKTRELEFTYVAMLDILLTALLGFVCILGITKCLQLLRFSPLINGLITVLSKAAAYILAFLFYSFCLFVVFVLFLHLLFCTMVGDFKSVGSSLMTLLLALSKQYSYSQVYKYDRFWGPMLLLACVLVFHIIVQNMIFAIIAAALRELKTLPQVAKDAEFLHMLFNRVFGWLDFQGRQERKKDIKAKVAALEPSDEAVNRSGF